MLVSSFKKKNNFIIFIITCLYVFFLTSNPNFFNKDFFFLIGDFSFYFDLKSFFKSGITGYYPNANNGEGGYDQIRYTIDIFIRLLSFILHDYLKLPLWIINRLLIFIPAVLLIYSLYDYLNFKTNNFIASILLSFYLSGTIFLLQNVNILIWLSIVGTIYYFKFLEEDIVQQKYKNIFFISITSVLMFSQLRTIIFLSYITFFYYLYLIFFKKVKLKYLLKYNFYLFVLVFILNIITIVNYIDTQNTFIVTSESVNLKDTRLEFINSYNLNNINPFYVLRFLINTNNASNNLLGKYAILHYLSFINFIILFFSLINTNKSNLKLLLIGYLFLFSISFYGTFLIKFFLVNIPGLWTLSSPYHIFVVGTPFIAYVYVTGVLNLVNSIKIKKIKNIIFFTLFIIFFLINASINFNYYIINYLKNNNYKFHNFIPSILTKNYIEVNTDYSEIKKK